MATTAKDTVSGDYRADARGFLDAMNAAGQTKEALRWARIVIGYEQEILKISTQAAEMLVKMSTALGEATNTKAALERTADAIATKPPNALWPPEALRAMGMLRAIKDRLPKAKPFSDRTFTMTELSEIVADCWQLVNEDLPTTER